MVGESSGSSVANSQNPTISKGKGKEVRPSAVSHAIASSENQLRETFPMSPEIRTDNSASQPLPEPKVSSPSGKGKGKVTGKLGGKAKGKGTLSATKKPVKVGGVRKRPGMLALREIKKLQAQTEYIVPRLPF